MVEKQEKVERKYLRVKAAARMYDIHPRKLREYLIRGLIPGATKPAFGKEWWIPIEGMETIMKDGVPKRHKR